MKCAAAVYKWKLQTVVKRQLLTSCVRGNYTNGSVQKCSELLEKAVKCQNTKLGGANENNANEILFVDCFPWNKLQFLGISSVLETCVCVSECIVDTFVNPLDSLNAAWLSPMSQL